MVNYPALSERLKKGQVGRDSFEVIFETIQKHYVNYFDLTALDNEAEVLSINKNSAEPGAYFTLCDHLMHRVVIMNVYTEPEIISILDIVITQLLTRDYYQKIFAPLVVKIKSPKGTELVASAKQANFMAKLATNNLPRITELTPFDIMCCAANMNFATNTNQFRIVERSHLVFLEPNSTRFLIINMSEKSEKLARWVAVDREKEAAYSEFLLYETEKSELEKFLRCCSLSYQNSNAEHAPSCGYAAINWLDCQAGLQHFSQGAEFWQQRNRLLQYLIPTRYRQSDTALLYEPLLLPEQDIKFYCDPFNSAVEKFTKNNPKFKKIH